MNDLLVALAAGEFEGEQDAQLRAHLEVCANCQAVFAEIHRAGELARSLKLESPELDRYPEFLRRLAARDAGSVALATAKHPIEQANPAAVPASAGMAMVIPLFGNRLALRNGFGQGFDLSITSRQGHQWLHLSATSLTRVAAVAAGVSLVAGISVVALLLMFSSRASQPNSQNPQGHDERAQQDKTEVSFRPEEGGQWLQTAIGAEKTLVIWKDGGQLQVMALDHGDRGEHGDVSRSNLWPLTPPMTGNRPQPSPRIVECSVATDGSGFVVLREIEGAIYLWKLEPQDGNGPASVSPPILLSQKGVQPAIAWIGDRYIAVWVAPDKVSPIIEMIEVGRDGRSMQTSATVVARTEHGDKVGMPSVAGSDGRALFTYFVQGGELMTRLFTRAGDDYDVSEALAIGNGDGYHMPIRLLPMADGFAACWDSEKHDGAEIRLARLNPQGRLLRQNTLVHARTPITSYDLRVQPGGRAILLWSEVQPGGALAFTQEFSLDGEPLNPPRNIFVADDHPSAVVFGDAAGKTLLWPQASRAGRDPIDIKQIHQQ